MTNGIHFVLQEGHCYDPEHYTLPNFLFLVQKTEKQDYRELWLAVTLDCFPFKYIFECETVSRVNS